MIGPLHLVLSALLLLFAGVIAVSSSPTLAQVSPDISVNNSQELYVFNEADQLLGEYDAQGNVVMEVIWHQGVPLAMNKKTAAGLELLFIETDHLATPRRLTDTQGRDRWSWISAPFGDTQPNENPQNVGAVTFNLRFAGQYVDKETNLHHNGFRDFDSTSGRYIQSDPVGLSAGINTYLYANANPLSFIDPDGLMACSSPRLISRIGESPRLIREAEAAGRSNQAGIDRLTEQLQAGNLNPGIGTKPIGKGLSEARARDGARVYFRQTEQGIEILGKSNKANQQQVIDEVLRLFGG